MTVHGGESIRAALRVNRKPAPEVGGEDDSRFARAGDGLAASAGRIGATASGIGCSRKTQAIEKALKGIISLRSNEMPPRLHNLVRLAELAGLKTNENQTELLREISAYYLQTRYPEEAPDLLHGQITDESEIRRVLERSQEMLTWLQSKLT